MPAQALRGLPPATAVALLQARRRSALWPSFRCAPRRRTPPHLPPPPPLQDACLELRLKEAEQLPGALRKMSLALSALPKMEGFIREVCALVLYEGGGGAPPDPAAPAAPPAPHAPQEVVAALRRWAAQLREHRQLQDLTLVLSRQLRGRASAAATSDGRPLPAPTGGGDGACLAPSELVHQAGPLPRSPPACGRGVRAPAVSPVPPSTPHLPRARQVRELIQHERQAQQALASYEQADLQLGAGPDQLLAKMVTHFQRLFDVRGTQVRARPPVHPAPPRSLARPISRRPPARTGRAPQDERALPLFPRADQLHTGPQGGARAPPPTSAHTPPRDRTISPAR